MIVGKLRPYLPFIVFATALFAAIFAIEKVNDRFWLNDFKVYYSAAQALRSGEQIYGIPFGLDTGFYKYSPFVAMLFVPYTFFPYQAASILHFAVLCMATILTIILLQKLICRHFLPVKNKAENILMSFALVCILLHLVRELHLGNINMLLLFLATAGLFFSLQSKYVLSGVFVGIAIIIKPYFLVLILPFIAAGKWRTVMSIAATAALSFLLPMTVLGYTQNLGLYNQWIDSMREHGNYLSSNHTIQSLLNNYFGLQTGNLFFYFLIAVISAGYMFLFFFFKSRQRKDEQAGSITPFYFISGYFCLTACIPNLVITDTEHFLLSLPLVMILLYYVSEKKNYLLIAFIILVFFYEGNSTDLLGKNLSQRFEEAGLLGISNLIIIGAVLSLNFFRLKNPSQPLTP